MNILQNLTPFGTSFLLVKTAPKIRGFGRECSEFYVLISVTTPYGHKVGDDVLIKLSDILKQNIRNVDILGRWGGEEFLIICPETNLRDAIKLAEKLRIEIDNYKFIVVNHITCSFGVTQYRVNDNKEEAFNRSDKALYLAKGQGRNKVVSSS